MRSQTQKTELNNLIHAASEFSAKKAEMTLNRLKMNRASIKLIDVVKTTGEVKDVFKITYDGKDYRSIPTDNVFRREVLEKLASKHNLLGIPGFYIDERGDVQMYVKKCGGIFIPICNSEGYIQGLQMRLDVDEDSGDKKFRWFSSKHFKDGTGAKPWIHIVGNTSAKEICLTEGAMKADVTSVLSDGQLFMAVPGVNAITYLPEVIRELGVTKVYEAFDMDKRSKPQVKQALIGLRTCLDSIGVEWQSCSWNPKYKGLDDYFLAKTMYAQSQAIAA